MAPWLLLTFIVSLLMTTEAYPQAKPIEIISPDVRLYEAAPGKILTACVRITNRDQGARELVPEFTAPPGWKQVSGSFPFIIQGDTSENVLVSFLVPGDALPGEYSLRYRVAEKDNPEVSDVYTIHVAVISGRRIELMPLALPEQFRLNPGSVVSVSMMAVNNGLESRTVVPRISLPEGWRLVTPATMMDVAGKEQRAFPLGFSIPKTASAGYYEVRCVLAGETDGEEEGACNIPVTVLPVTSIELKVIRSPAYVIAGNKYTVTYSVRNASNTSLKMGLRLISGGNWPCRLESSSLTLPAGEEKRLNAQVDTDAGLLRPEQHYLRLVVTSQNLAMPDAETAGVVEVIPAISGDALPYHGIPSRFTTRYISGNGGGGGVQGEVSGRGSLDEDGKHHVEYLVRQPDRQGDARLGLSDTFQAGYWTDTYGIYAGDLNFRLSPLTENYFYGRGVRGEASAGGMTAGLFHAATRSLVPGITEDAAYMKYAVSKQASVKVNYLRKVKDEKEKGTLVSVEGNYRRRPGENLGIELASSAGGGSGRAYAARYTRYRGPYFTGSSFVRKDPAYPFGNGGLQQFTQDAGMSIGKKTRVSATAQIFQDNLAADQSVSSSASREVNVRAGAEYSLTPVTTLLGDLNRRQRQDRLGIPDFDYREHTLRLGVRNSWQRLSWSATFEAGAGRDNLTGGSYDPRGWRIEAYYRPDSPFSYSAYCERTENGQRNGETDELFVSGFGAHCRLGRSTTADLMVQQSDQRGATTLKQQDVEVRLSHILANKHTFSLLNRYAAYSRSERKNENSLSMEYSIPFDLPVSGRRNNARIEGIIRDFLTGKPLKGIGVRCNDLAVASDAQGKFRFCGLEAGTYHLSVDATGAGIRKLSVPKSPIDVELETGKNIRAEISLVDGASLRGKVSAYSPLDQYINVATGQERWILDTGRGLEGVKLELDNGTETLTCITGSDGSFSFDELMPGRWSLWVKTETMPDDYHPEEEPYLMEFVPGQDAELQVRVVARRRAVRIMQDGGRITEEKARKPWKK